MNRDKDIKIQKNLLGFRFLVDRNHNIVGYLGLSMGTMVFYYVMLIFWGYAVIKEFSNDIIEYGMIRELTFVDTSLMHLFWIGSLYALIKDKINHSNFRNQKSKE